MTIIRVKGTKAFTVVKGDGTGLPYFLELG